MIKNDKQWAGNYAYFPIKIFLIWYYQLTKYQDQNFTSPDIKESVFLKSSSDAWWYNKLSCLNWCDLDVFAYIEGV